MVVKNKSRVSREKAPKSLTKALVYDVSIPRMSGGWLA